MPDARWGDPREYGERDRDDGRPRVYEERDRDDHDPRDGLMHDLDLPRGEERELVVDRDRVYELNSEDGRTLAAVGAFRVVPEHDLDIYHDTLEHLHDEGLVETVKLGDDERGLTLTREGRDLLDSHSMDRDDEPSQAFYAGVSRERELDHDSNLYATYRQEEARLRDEHGGLEIRRVVLEQNLKREYQEFLQEHNRGRSDSDGRPDRDEHEIREWARELDLPYFDGQVHFPDYRIEYEIDGRELHQDVELFTEHYRGAHAASHGQTGFRIYVVGSRADRAASARHGGIPVTHEHPPHDIYDSVAACTTTRRRCLPPRPRVPKPMSLHQRWRERPRLRALHLTPRRLMGSFTPSLVVPRVAVHEPGSCRRDRAAYVHIQAAAAAAVFPGRNRVRRKSVESNRRNGATFQLLGAVREC